MTRAAVTKVAGYNGAIACEYEIRDDLDALLAADYVLIHPHPGERATDIRELLTNWLRIRAAKWELSDTEEKRSRRRERRVGQRLDSAEPAPLNLGNVRDVSVTTAEADSLARPSGLLSDDTPEFAIGFRI